jgi:hypothetical protein
MPEKKLADHPATHAPEKPPAQDLVAHLIPLGRAENRSVNYLFLEGILEQLQREEKKPPLRLKRPAPERKLVDRPTATVPDKSPEQDLVAHLIPLGRAENRSINYLFLEGILEQLQREERKPAIRPKRSARPRRRSAKR